MGSKSSLPLATPSGTESPPAPTSSRTRTYSDAGALHGSSASPGQGGHSGGGGASGHQGGGGGRRNRSMSSSAAVSSDYLNTFRLFQPWVGSGGGGGGILTLSSTGESLPTTASFYSVKCPICSKQVNHPDVEVHLVMCLTRPRLNYNEEILSPDSSRIGTECSICLEELVEKDLIARLPCLCVYHKTCIDSWFTVNRVCPEHPL